MEMKTRSRRIGLLVAALILILALSGIAFAAVRSGLMDALFYGRAPSPEAERLIEKAAASDTEAGITASIDEYIRDGNTLTVSWSVESALDEPVLIRDDIQLTARVGDVSLRQMSGSGDMDMFAIVLGGSTGGHTFPRRQSATTTFEIPDGLSEKLIQLALDTKGVYRLDKPLQYVKDAVGGDWSDAPGGYKTIDAILVDESGRTEPYDYPGVSERVDKAWEAAGKPSYEDGKEHYGAYDAMADLGLISRLAAPHATADAAPSDAAQTRSTKANGPSAFEFDGYTLRVEKLDFSAASTNIILTASPKPARPIAEPKPEQGAQDLYDPLFTSYYVLDKDGNNLLGNISGGWDVFFDGTDSSGNPCIRYVYHGNPLTKAPDSVIIVPSSEMRNPYDGNDGPGGADYEAYVKAHFLMDEAVTVEVAPQ
jgi:hypothetical protein